MGTEYGLVVLVAQFVPKAQVPVGVQLAAPETNDVVQSAGNAGAVIESKFSAKTTVVPGVSDGVGVGVGVCGGVGEASLTGNQLKIESIRQPPPDPLQSVASRKRSLTEWLSAARGRFTVVEI